MHPKATSQTFVSMETVKTQHFYFLNKSMNLTDRVTKWVESKVGNVVSNEIEVKVTSETSFFDVEKCAENLLNSNHFNESELKNHLMNHNSSIYRFDSESDDSKTDEESQDLLDCEQLDFQIPSLDEIIRHLHGNEKSQVLALEMLEVSPAEELIIQTSWTLVRKILQDTLRSYYLSNKIPLLVLKVFRRFLSSNDSPKTVCEGFITLCESINFHIETINSTDDYISSEEIYDFKENRWFWKNLENRGKCQVERISPRTRNTLNVEILMRSMWLLIEAQKSMPGKWIRFHEKRQREIIFSFINLLSSTMASEDEKISGLEIISVLNPKATWCRHWCHGALGRSLLCLALRRHKKFFNHVIEIIFEHMKSARFRHFKNVPKTNEKTRKKFLRSMSEDENSNILQKRNKKSLFRDKSFENDQFRKSNKSSKIIHSAPSFSKHEKIPPISGNKTKISKPQKSEWIINGIPNEIVQQAKFCHCFSLVAFVVQYRAGRSLFPVNMSSRKRQLTIQDLISSMINYVENLERGEFLKKESPTQTYREHLINMNSMLKLVESKMNPRVNTQRVSVTQRQRF